MVNEGMRDHRAAEREREAARLERRTRRECTFFGGMVGAVFFMAPTMLSGAPPFGVMFIGIVGFFAGAYMACALTRA